MEGETGTPGPQSCERNKVQSNEQVTLIASGRREST